MTSSNWINELVNYFITWDCFFKKLNIVLFESQKVLNPLIGNLELGHKSYYFQLEINIYEK